MNYKRYYLSASEWIRILGEFLIIDFLTAIIFYDSFVAFFVGFAGLMPYISYRKKAMSDAGRITLRDQFIELIGNVSGKMRGGMSCENALIDSYSDMEAMFGRNSPICRELKQIGIRMNHQESLSKCLLDLGTKSGTSDIYEFAQVFSIAKAGSGRMRDVIEDTIDMMKEKNETESEIRVLLSGKRLEQRIMCLIPLGIILYFKMEVGDFIGVLYHNVFGIGIMSTCLAIYIISYLIAERVVNIEV